jgi:hypothetical protein
MSAPSRLHTAGSSESAALRLADFGALAPPPFNTTIRISQAVTWFDGRLLVGGGRGPIRGAGQPDRALGAQIASWDPGRDSWDLVYDSPVDGQGNARDRSIRAFAIHQPPGASAPVLYAAAGAMTGQMVLLQSGDGRRFIPCGAPALGQGDADIAAIRSLVALGGRLFTSPVGKNRGRGWADDNVADRPVVLASADPALGWEEVSAPGFGDPDNESINELAVLGDRLYAATLNRRAGFQLWKSAPGGAGPWTCVLDRGAGRGIANPVPAAVQVFGGALYIGTGVQRQPDDSTDRFGPIAAELIRVWPDDSWDLVAGQTRLSAGGLRRPVSARGPGFDDPFVQTFWRTAVHEGRLYVGGSDWRFWPTYLGRPGRPRDDLSPVTAAWLRAETDGWRGEYGLWCSTDGQDWQVVTDTGLTGNPAQYGLRELISIPQGLIAIPAARAGGAGAGVEVLLGRSAAGATP